MTDCKSNHARLVRLEGELHKSGKDYRCQDCGDIVEVEVKPAEIGVTFGTGALPGCTAQAIEESGKWNYSEMPTNATIGGLCSKCGHVHISIVCTCGCDISGKLLRLEAVRQPSGQPTK